MLNELLNTALPVSGLSGGSTATSSAADGKFSDMSPVNIAPVGLNLGAILKPFNEGSFENGGYGFMKELGLWPNGSTSSSQADALGYSRGNSNYMALALVAGIAGLLLVMAKKKKRG